MKKGVRKRFLVQRIEVNGSETASVDLFRLNDRTRITFSDSDTSSTLPVANGKHGDLLSSERIGGLFEQLQTLNRRMRLVLEESAQADGRQVSQNVLIHGFEGTGKTVILDELAQAPFRKVVRIDKDVLSGTGTKNQTTIEEQFAKAREHQPSLVIMDRLEKIASSSADSPLTSTIVRELDRLAKCRILTVAACRSPLDVDGKLFTKGRFTGEIELPAPDQRAREDILGVLLTKTGHSGRSIARELSARTHAFTGQDLSTLVGKAEFLAAGRARFPNPAQNQETNGADGVIATNGQADAQVAGSSSRANGTLHEGMVDEAEIPTMADFEAALQTIRPTALREIVLERPQLSWNDIGGSQTMQSRFDRIVRRQTQDTDDEYNLPPQKGVLLYGPPGCSKTLTAKAVAAVYGLNFINIKGAELVSMYVGESERAIREIFRKARSAAPCVIFFDEIDAIASERDTSGAKGLNVVTTLLNEMDGFESLKGVIVLAATNKPDVLDPAIMRPGRFDEHIFSGPPDLAARKQIFSITTRGVPVETDVDFDELAARTGGHSGAEIVRICHIAAEEARERKYAGDVARKAVRMADYEDACVRTSRQITTEMLAGYEKFAAKGKSPL